MDEDANIKHGVKGLSELDWLYAKTVATAEKDTLQLHQLEKCVMALQASAPTPAAFSRLCDLAAAARLSEQPEFQGWTAQTGRVRLASDAIAAVGSVLFGLGTLQHKTQHI